MISNFSRLPTIIELEILAKKLKVPIGSLVDKVYITDEPDNINPKFHGPLYEYRDKNIAKKSRFFCFQGEKLVEPKIWYSKRPRAYTEAEIREMFIKHLWGIWEYWLKESRQPDTKDKMSGMLHSILATIDGCSGGICGFKVIPNPHPSDKDYNKERGENWFPDNIDIGGGLHEIFYKFKPDAKG